MAEYLGVHTLRTGGRVVDCSGLENQRQESPETTETADFCGSQDAQDAMFTPRSATRDGKKVGTRRRWIYFIQSGEDGPIKIGSAFDVHERCATLQTGNPERLTVRCFFRCENIAHERNLHSMFRDHNIWGEWFRPAAPILSIIDFHEQAARARAKAMRDGQPAPAILAEIERLKDTPNGH